MWNVRFPELDLQDIVRSYFREIPQVMKQGCSPAAKHFLSLFEVLSFISSSAKAKDKRTSELKVGFLGARAIVQ